MRSSETENSWSGTDSIIQEMLEKRLKSGNDHAFFVFNQQNVKARLELWKQRLPRVTPFFAVKANHSNCAIETMAKLGTGFDCASKREIKRVLDYGVHPDRIIYAHPTKQASYIEFARLNGVRKMTFDSAEELGKIKALCPDAKVVLRIRCDAEKSFISLGEKFGCDPDIDAKKLMEKCREQKMNLIGICFHSGVDHQDARVYYEALKIIRNLFDFAETVGFKLNFVDIGGGFPGRNMKLFNQCSDFINRAIDEYFPDPSIEIISEPGLYFMQTSMKLLSCVHSKRVQRDKNDQITQMHYFLNEGIFSSFLGSHMYQLKPAMKPFNPPKYKKESKTFPSIFWGQTATSIDKILEDNLPEVSIGDWFIFNNRGAYESCIATEFNGFPMTDIIYLESPGSMELRSKL